MAVETHSAMPFFSVVIPTFNRSELLLPTLDSVLNQTFSDFEIIVADDGSTDNTVQVLSDYIQNKRLKNVTVLVQSNQGPGIARNLGIRAAKGRYIAFLDSDDLWLPWTLATYVQTIEKTQANFISGTAFDFKESREVADIEKESLVLATFPDYAATASENIWVLPSATAIETATLQAANGFTEAWINGEDSDLWLKLGIAKGFTRISSPYISVYRRHEESAIANSEKTVQGSFYLIAQENQAHYPGGTARRQQRLDIITRHVRPVSLACLQQKNIKDAWHLYASTFLWNLRLGRVKYLAAFWAIAALSLLHQGSKNQSIPNKHSAVE